MKSRTSISPGEVRALFEFRYNIRDFLAASEKICAAHRLRPQQYQLMLAIKAMPGEEPPYIAVLARRLQLRHHSVVELANRLSALGLARRARSRLDRRLALVELTPAGNKLFQNVAMAHRAELQHTGPVLVRALTKVLDA